MTAPAAQFTNLNRPATFVMTLADAALIQAALAFVLERTADKEMRRLINALQRQADQAMVASALSAHEVVYGS